MFRFYFILFMVLLCVIYKSVCMIFMHGILSTPACDVLLDVRPQVAQLQA